MNPPVHLTDGTPELSFVVCARMTLGALTWSVSGADVRLAAGIFLLIGVALGACAAAGVAQGRAIVVASVRAAAQLTLVAAALRGVFAAPWAVIAVLAVMFGVATWTAGRRISMHPDALSATVLSCAAGAVVAIGIIVGLPTLSRDVRTLVAVSGIVLGGTMTAATLTGRKLADALHRRRDEVEAWLSIGATPRQAVRALAR